MQKFWIHIQLHSGLYMIPLILTLVISMGIGGVAISGIPIERVKSQALLAFIDLAKSMTHRDPSQKSSELIKLEGRRRKNGWKDIQEETPWNHRFMEEGTEYKPWCKYKITLQSNLHRYTKRHALQDIYLKLEISVFVIFGLFSLFTYFVGGSYMSHFNEELIKYSALMGR